MDELEKSVLETIKGSDLSALSKDYAELFIDSIIKDGVLKEKINRYFSLRKELEA